jgi:1-acyl-sn-glycerol-3-phosphate acyltransferase
MSLGQSLDALLRSGPLTAHVYVGEALAPGADRRTLAAQAQQTVGTALRSLQGAGAPARAAAVLESEASAIPNAAGAAASPEGTLIDNVDQHGQSA